MSKYLKNRILSVFDKYEESIGEEKQLAVHCVNYGNASEKILKIIEEENRTIHAAKKTYVRSMNCQLHGEPYDIDGISVRLFLPVINKEKTNDFPKHFSDEQIENKLKEKYGKDKIIVWHEDYEFELF